MYDPLLETYPKPHEPYPNSYWADGVTAPQTERLEQDLQTDVVVIGAGYTGLSAAYHLRQKFNANVVVVEANQVGWGCSGRNAGFVLAGTGRLALQQMKEKWGEKATHDIYREYQMSIDSVQRLIAHGNIDCDQTEGGYIKLAHKPIYSQALREQADMLRNEFGEQAEFVEQKQVNREFLRGVKNFGGIYYPKTFAVNPLKLAFGYHRLALDHGVKVFGNTPVVDWLKRSRRHKLRTPGGSITCDHVIIATNGYTPKNLHPIVANRHFPVISSIIVTRPLTDHELNAIGSKAGLMAMDTRALKYYYRLLPDNRILFGGRGAIKGIAADDVKYRDQLLAGLISTFPPLKDITAEYFWSGWVSVSFDDYPRVWKSEDRTICYAMGYCGSGLAFATQAGKRLAQHIGGVEKMPDLPFWHSPLQKFPFSPFRRWGLRAFYAWQRLQD